MSNVPFFDVIYCLVEEVFVHLLFIISSGVSVVCCGEEMLWGVGITSHLRGFVLLDGVLISVAYDVGVCYGRSFCFMYACHEGCMSVNV